MKSQHMLKYYISTILILLMIFSVEAQNNPDSDQDKSQDSTKFKQKYGLRLGVDVGKQQQRSF